MKKIAVLLIALMMTLTAVALAEYEEPILFRGLEWGCSYADIGEETELKLRGLSDCESHSVAYTMSGGEDIPFMEFHKDGGWWKRLKRMFRR